jgi:hypothetical protein
VSALAPVALELGDALLDLVGPVRVRVLVGARLEHRQLVLELLDLVRSPPLHFLAVGELEPARFS